MNDDLSTYHTAVGDLFPKPSQPAEWSRYRLTDAQVESYRNHGYLTGVEILNDDQVKVLREELRQLVDPGHPGNKLFYEFNSNESADPEKVLFHALGAWRITPGLHDLLWHPAF